MAHVAKWKYREVEELKQLLTSKPVVGIVGLEKIPARQMQEIRAGLRGHAVIRMSRNRLIRMAIEEAARERPEIAELKNYVTGQTAIVCAEMNPFKLFRKIEEMKAKAPARPGDVVPEDIVIRKGETPFKPGPIVGELQKAGIPAAIEGGKVVIRKDHTLLRSGDTVTREIATLLSRLEILPITVGLEGRAFYEDGVIYTPSVLAIDLEAFRQDLIRARTDALKLAVAIGYATPETIIPLLSDARRKAIALALAAGIPTKESLPLLLQKAHAQMLSVASRLSDGLDDDLKRLIPTASKVDVTGDEKREEKEEEKAEIEEEPEEEEVAAGLGALFG